MPSSPSVTKAQQKAIQKADTLIEALGWIRKFRDTTTVIKLGGSVVEHPDSLRHLLLDIVFLSTLGMRIVVVHGGGKAISRAMDAAGIVPRFVQGRRYTDPATLAIVERVLATELNQELVARIEEYGGRAMSLNFLSTNVLFGEKLVLDGFQACLWSKPLNARWNASRFFRIVIHESPACAPSSTSISNRCRSSPTGRPHSSSW